MQRKNKDKTGSLLSLKTYFLSLKKLFKFWLIAALLICFLNVGYSFGEKIVTGNVTAIVNFSFDGIESGVDPNGNKFDVSAMKTKEIIQDSLDELDLNDADAEKIGSYISIDGVVPSDVIERITNYTSLFDSETVASSKYIQDTSYYPTQYKIELEYAKAGLSKKDGAELLNKMTEKYYNVFYNTYGYNVSLESAVKSIDYKDYDYVDAVDVFNASLSSLQNYINELASKDNTRFRAENGYSFADISASIDTIRNEDLDWISSYIMLNNVTKDKDALIENYKFRIDDLKRNKKIAEETVNALAETIEEYEKSSILIFANATDGASASLNQSSDTYNNLITQKLDAQSTLSSCEQNINRYEERIKSLESGSSNKSENEIVESKFENISLKIDNLLTAANETAVEYYETVFLNNAYTVISPADSSMISIVKSAIAGSINNITMFECILIALYLSVSVVICFVKIPEPSGRKNKKTKKAKKSK